MRAAVPGTSTAGGRRDGRRSRTVRTTGPIRGRWAVAWTGGVRTPRTQAALTRARRESAGLSVREVAEQADALLGTVAGWFAGQHAPTKASREPFERVLAVCGVAPGNSPTGGRPSTICVP